MGLFSKISDGLKKTRESMKRNFAGIFSSGGKITEEMYEELLDAMILADVGVTTAEKICEQLKARVKQTGASEMQQARALLKEIIAELLGDAPSLNLSTQPSVVLVIGVNGVGKTTTIGKLAAYLKSQGKSVLMAAADTFRAAAIDQLAVWAQRSGADLVKHAEGADPAAVIFDAIAAGKARGRDVILCDTAGRLHNKKNLMDELAKISRVIQREAPDSAVEVLLVLDATTGQNALNQAKQFQEVAGLTGIILTKLDGTAKGGVVIAIKDQLQVPIQFIGVGEQVDDLRPFDAKDFANALFEETQAV